VAGPSTTWHVEISFSEDVNHTDAVAVLRTPDDREHRGYGQARRNPAGPVSRLRFATGAVGSVAALARPRCRWPGRRCWSSG